MPKKSHYSFGMQLALLSRSWRAALDRRLSHLGLSQARWVVLLHLARSPELPTQRELAQVVGVEGPTLARLLDSLEEQGLVRRVAVLEDRRAKKVILTDQAQPLIEEIRAISMRLHEEMFDGIDDEELSRCMAVQAKILSNLANDQ